MILFSAKYTSGWCEEEARNVGGAAEAVSRGPVARPGAAGPPPPDARRPRSAHQRPGRHQFRAGTNNSTYTSAHSTPYLSDAAWPPTAATTAQAWASSPPTMRAGSAAAPPIAPGLGRAGPGRRLASGPDRLGRRSTALPVAPPGDSCERTGRRPCNAHTPRQADVVTARHDLEYRWTVSPRGGGGGLAGRRRGSRSGTRPRCKPSRSSTCGGRCGRSPGGRRVRRCR